MKNPAFFMDFNAITPNKKYFIYGVVIPKMTNARLITSIRFGMLTIIQLLIDC